MDKSYKIKSRHLSKVFFDKQHIFFYLSYEINNNRKEEKIIFDNIEEFDVFVIKNKNILRDVKDNKNLLCEMYSVIFPERCELSRRIAVEALSNEFFGSKTVSLVDFAKNDNNLSFLLFFNYVATMNAGVIKLSSLNFKIVLKDVRSIVGIVLENMEV